MSTVVMPFLLYYWHFKHVLSIFILKHSILTFTLILIWKILKIHLFCFFFFPLLVALILLHIIKTLRWCYMQKNHRIARKNLFLTVNWRPIHSKTGFSENRYIICSFVINMRLVDPLKQINLWRHTRRGIGTAAFNSQQNLWSCFYAVTFLLFSFFLSFYFCLFVLFK